MLADAPERKAGEAEDDDTANDVLVSAALASSKDADNRIFQLLVAIDQGSAASCREQA